MYLIFKARRTRVPRAQVGQGFAERLVEDGWFQNVRPGPAQLPEQRPRGN